MKQLIKEEKFKKTVSQRFGFEFSITAEGLYLIEISARARSEKQIGNNETDDDDLRIEIDGRRFAQLGEPARYFDSPAAFSGGQLHNLKKTVVFLCQFSEGKHVLAFIPDREPTLEDIKIYQLKIEEGKLILELNQQAEDGDRRDWLTISLMDLPLKEMSVELICQKRKFDRDDVKIIIDGEIKINLKNGFRKFWYWIWAFFSDEKQADTFVVNFKKDAIHYIEFWADRMPTLNKVILDFGNTPIKRIPTVYDPEWAGDFRSDPEDILLARLIFGEARGEPLEAKIWVAGSVLNRMKSGAWPDTIYDVITQPQQFDPLKPGDKNYNYVIDPFWKNDKRDILSWQECYKIARDILSGQITNPTDATHFHGKGVDVDWFKRTIVPNGKFLRRIGDTYFYWSPN